MGRHKRTCHTGRDGCSIFCPEESAVSPPACTCTFSHQAVSLQMQYQTVRSWGLCLFGSLTSQELHLLSTTLELFLYNERGSRDDRGVVTVQIRADCLLKVLLWLWRSRYGKQRLLVFLSNQQPPHFIALKDKRFGFIKRHKGGFLLAVWETLMGCAIPWLFADSLSFRFAGQGQAAAGTEVKKNYLGSFCVLNFIFCLKETNFQVSGYQINMKKVTYKHWKLNKKTLSLLSECFLGIDRSFKYRLLA